MNRFVAFGISATLAGAMVVGCASEKTVAEHRTCPFDVAANANPSVGTSSAKVENENTSATNAPAETHKPATVAKHRHHRRHHHVAATTHVRRHHRVAVRRAEPYNQPVMNAPSRATAETTVPPAQPQPEIVDFTPGLDEGRTGYFSRVSDETGKLGAQVDRLKKSCGADDARVKQIEDRLSAANTQIKRMRFAPGLDWKQYTPSLNSDLAFVQAGTQGRILAE